MLTHDQMYNKMGVPNFAALIVELNVQRVTRDPEAAVFTIRDQKEGYISLKRIFVASVADDPSEASFAEKVFNDVGYWLRVRDHKELAPFLAKWREEAEVIRKSQAFKAMTKEVKEEGKSAFAAAKYLIEEPWKGRTKKVLTQKRGTSNKAAESVKSDLENIREYLQ